MVQSLDTVARHEGIYPPSLAPQTRHLDNKWHTLTIDGISTAAPAPP